MKLHRYFTVQCILFLALSAPFFPSTAQEIIKVNGIKGVGVIAGRLSFDDARHSNQPDVFYFLLSTLFLK
jgi:hypothetical protein